MKRIPFLLLLTLMLLPASCTEGGILPADDYPVVDWYPVNVIITVKDSQGNDLLDPSREGSFAHGTKLTFKGETYGVQSILNTTSTEEAQTKMYLARMRGLQLAHGQVWFSEQEQRTCYYLVFGEIDGAKDFDDDLVVKWPDGTEDVIHYYCGEHKVKRKADGTWDISCDRTWKLNKKAADNPFKLVK